MTQDEALDLIRRLLKARDEAELMQLVSLSLPVIDGAFFNMAEAVIRKLEREGRPGPAAALSALTDRMLSMKTLI